VRALELITSLEVGGAERLLLRRVPLLQAAGVDVTVCSLKSGTPLAAELAGRGVALHELGSRSFRDLGAVSRLARLIARGRYDVVHLHLFRARVWGAPLARLARVPLVVQTEHTLSLDALEGRPHSRGSVAAGIAVGRLAHVTVAVSEATRDALERVHRIPSRRIVVIPNGIALDEFAAADGDEPAVDVVALARLHRDKGLDVLVNAIAELRRRGRDVTCEIGGGGPEARSLADDVRGAGVGDLVRFVGPVADVAAFLRRGRVAAVPSRREAFGIAALEAMAAGVSVVASRAGGLAELVEDGATGVLVRPDDPRALANGLARVLGDDALRARLADAGRLAARRYDLARSTERLVELYVSGRSRRSSR
jgi:glycosyltransferase involved in cell wall biosynthesis